MKADFPFVIIKFGKKAHIESLFNKGELYFSSTITFNEDKGNTERGDQNEGAIWIENIELKSTKLNHPKYGEFNFKLPENTLHKLTQFNHNYLTCSFYMISTKNFEKTDTFKIDKRMLEFGEYALFIKDPKAFQNDFIKAIELENLSYTAKRVSYENLESKGRIDMNPFMKKLAHSHQNEYRIILKNNIKPRIIKLKNIKKYSTIIKAKHLTESDFTAVRS